MRAKDLRLVEARIGHQLAARGYELSSEPLQVSSTRDKCIRLQSTLGAFRQRIASYGFWLVAIEFASRHVGWIKVHSAVHRAIDKIINENLK